MFAPTFTDDIIANFEEIRSILQNPAFLSVLDEANSSTSANELPEQSDLFSTISKSSPHISSEQSLLIASGNTNDSANSEQIGVPASSGYMAQAIDKLRNQTSANASPNSVYSSSSESHTSHQTQKHKNRICLKCNKHFKHRHDWLNHLKQHVKLPIVLLERVEENNDTSNYESISIDQSSKSDPDGLKIKLKISRKKRTTINKPNDNSDAIDSTPSENMDNSTANTVNVADSALHSIEQNGTNNGSIPTEPNNSAAPESNSNGSNDMNRCRIRVLTAAEIKRSPVRELSTPPNLDSIPMVSFPSNDDLLGFDCPTFDSFGQTDDDSSTADLLKQLLENTNEQPEQSDFDATSSEFIQLDELAVECAVCKEKFPDNTLLEMHKKNSGHNSVQLPSPTLPYDRMGENRQVAHASTSQSAQQLHQILHPTQSSQTNHLQHLLSQPMKPLQPIPPMLYQPQPVMARRSTISSTATSQVQLSQQQMPMDRAMLHMSRFMQPRGPSHLNQPNHLGHPNQPSHQNYPNHSNSLNHPNHPNHLSHPNHPNNPNHLNMQRHPMHPMNHPKHLMRPPMHMMHDNTQQSKNMPPYMNMNAGMYNPPNGLTVTNRQNMMHDPAMTNQRRPSISPGHQYTGSRFPIGRQMSSLPIRNPGAVNSTNQTIPPPKPILSLLLQSESFAGSQPIIAQAPHTDGLPIIESVQSGTIILTKARPADGTSRKRSILQRELYDMGRTPMQSTSTNANAIANEKVTSILSNPNLTVRSSTSGILNEAKAKAKAMDNSKKTPYSTAQEAVQRLKMNNSVSIIMPKKKANVTAAEKATTVKNSGSKSIDLANEDEIEEVVPGPSTSTKSTCPPGLKCPMKLCKRRFKSPELLRRHVRQTHQVIRSFRCSECSARFISPETMRAHIKNAHRTGHAEFGLPAVDISDANARQALLALGFSNFIPIRNGIEKNERIFGVPIINLNASSVDAVKNIFGVDTTRLLPLDTVQPIARKDAQTETQRVQDNFQTFSNNVNSSVSTASKKPSSPPVSIRGLLRTNREP